MACQGLHSPTTAPNGTWKLRDREHSSGDEHGLVKQESPEHLPVHRPLGPFHWPGLLGSGCELYTHCD